MAGYKRVPDGWERLPHLQIKYIKGRAYCYVYDPATQKERYIGAIEPRFGIIDSMSAAQRKTLVARFNRNDGIQQIMDYIETCSGWRISKQATYLWFREHGIEGRWLK